jgi:hypothetical protein
VNPISPSSARTLRVLFLGEGTSDNGIAPHIESLAAERGIRTAITVPDLGRLSERVGHAVSDKLRVLRRLGGEYELVVLHRDADRDGPEARRLEISDAIAAEWPDLVHVPAIPVRMLEAWLLLDEASIRLVAQNPNGRAKLGLPKPNVVESIADPKALLKQTLAVASGLSGRRLEQFQKRFSENRLRLLELLDPHGPVTALPSWCAFLDGLDAAFTAWEE